MQRCKKGLAGWVGVRRCGASEKGAYRHSVKPDAAHGRVRQQRTDVVVACWCARVPMCQRDSVSVPLCQRARVSVPLRQRASVSVPLCQRASVLACQRECGGMVPPSGQHHRIPCASMPACQHARAHVQDI